MQDLRLPLQPGALQTLCASLPVLQNCFFGLARTPLTAEARQDDEVGRYAYARLMSCERMHHQAAS